MSKKDTMAIINFANIDDEFIRGLNYCYSYIYKMGLAQDTLKEVSKDYDKKHDVVTDTDKHDKREFLKPYRKAEKDARNLAEQSALKVFSSHLKFDDDIFNLSREDFVNLLIRLGVASDNATPTNLKNTASDKVFNLYKAVVNRVKPSMVMLKKGTKDGKVRLTVTESKTLKNTYSEVALAFYEGLPATGCFEINENNVLVKKVFETESSK